MLTIDSVASFKLERSVVKVLFTAGTVAVRLSMTGFENNAKATCSGASGHEEGPRQPDTLDPGCSLLLSPQKV